MKYIIIILVVATLVIFGRCDNSCPTNYFQNIKTETIYVFSENFVTQNLGISIDVDKSLYYDNKQFIDSMNNLESRIEKIKKCIEEVFQKELLFLSQLQIIDKYQCLFVPNVNNINYNCIKIKIVKPILSKCSNWQFIDAFAPEQYCLEKGLNPSVDCPCRWRTAVLNDHVLITPPELYLWELVRIMTGCNYIWKEPLDKCAML